MKRLHLLRHAKASRDDPALDDHERPLERRGERQSRALASHLAGTTVRPELVLCSTARRARETLDLVRPGLPGEPLIRFERALYLAEPDQLLKRLRRVEPALDEVLLVGHNDGIHDLARLLAGSGPGKLLARLAERFPTAALASLELDADWQALGPGRARLVGYLTPRDLD